MRISDWSSDVCSSDLDFRGLLRAEPLGADLVLLEESEELRVLHRPLISRDQLLPGLRMAVAEFGRSCETADGTVDHRNFHADFGKRLVHRRRVTALCAAVAHDGQRSEHIANAFSALAADYGDVDLAAGHRRARDAPAYIGHDVS